MASSREEEPVAVPPSRLEIELVCSICLKLFQEPHILGCSHSFCLACLKGCIPEGREEGSCPECLSRFQLRQLIYNRSLGKLAEEIRRLRGDQAFAARRHVCPEHDEPLKLFCSQDEEPICVICRELPRHRGHEFVPTKNAVEGSQLMRRDRCLLQPCRGTYKLPGTTRSHHATTQTENAVHGEKMADFEASTSLAPTTCRTTAKQVRGMNWTTKETADSPVQEQLGSFYRKRVAQNALSDRGRSKMPFFSGLNAIFHGDASVTEKRVSRNVDIVVRSPGSSSSGAPNSDCSTPSIVEEHHSSSPPESGTTTDEENQDEVFIPTMENPDQTIRDEGDNVLPVPEMQMEDHAQMPLDADKRSGAGTVSEEQMDADSEDTPEPAWGRPEERIDAMRSKRRRTSYHDIVEVVRSIFAEQRRTSRENHQAWIDFLQRRMDQDMRHERESMLQIKACGDRLTQVLRKCLGGGMPAPSHRLPSS